MKKVTPICIVMVLLMTGLVQFISPNVVAIDPDYMDWTSIPVIMMDTTTPYEWNATTNMDELVNVTYALSTNATWLSINATTGVLSGSNDTSGTYFWVNVTASAEFYYDLSLNYTLTVMDDIYVDSATYGMYSYGANIVQYGNRVYMVYLSNVENDAGTYYMYLMAKEYDGSNWSDGYQIAYVGEPDGSAFNVSEGGPTICRDGEGYLHVFFSGTEDWQIFCYYRSDNPDSVASWTYMEDMCTNRAYVSPGTFQYATYDPKNDQIWLFYLFDSTEGELRAINSSDGGDTWGRLYWDDYLTLIDPWAYMDLRGDNVYMTKEGDDYYVNFPFISLDADFHKHNAYFFKFNLTNRHMYNASGADLGGNEISWTFLSRNTNILVYRDDSESHITGITVATTVSGKTVAVLNYNGTFMSVEWDGVAWENMTNITNISTGNNYNSTVGFLWNEGNDLVAVLTTSDFGDDNDPIGQGYGGNVTRWIYDETAQSWSQLPTLLNTSQSFAGSFNYLLRGTDASYAGMANVFGVQAMYPETEADEDYWGPWGIVIAGTDYAGRLTVIGNGTRLAQWAPTITTTGNGTQDYESYLLYDADSNETTGGEPVFGMDTDATFLEINATTGVVNGTVNVTGSYYVNISCLSIFGLGTGYENFTLTIIGGGSPAINNTPDWNITSVWVEWYWNATCTAPDNGTSTWTLDTNASGLSIGFENDTCANVSGTITTIGSYYVNLTVNDTDSSYSYNFTLDVIAGESPAITTTPYPLNATEDSAWYYLVGADFATGETWGMTTNATWLSRSSNNYSGTPTNAYSEHSYYLNVTVTTMNGTDYQNVTIFVYNNAPVFSSTPTATGTNGTAYSYDAVTSDEDVGATSYAIAENYTWAVTFNLTTGVLTLTPNVTGIFWFNITFDDGTGVANSTVSQNFTVTVSASSETEVPVDDGGGGGGIVMSIDFTFTVDNNYVRFTLIASTAYQSVRWSFGDGTGSTEANPTHSYQSVDRFEVIVEVTDLSGRVLQAVHYVDIETVADFYVDDGEIHFEILGWPITLTAIGLILGGCFALLLSLPRFQGAPYIGWLDNRIRFLVGIGLIALGIWLGGWI